MSMMDYPKIPLDRYLPAYIKIILPKAFTGSLVHFFEARAFGFHLTKDNFDDK